MAKVSATFLTYFQQSSDKEESKVATAALKRQATTILRKHPNSFRPTKSVFITICNDNYELTRKHSTDATFKNTTDLPSVRKDNDLVRQAFEKFKGYKYEEQYNLRNASS